MMHYAGKLSSLSVLQIPTLFYNFLCNIPIKKRERTSKGRFCHGTVPGTLPGFVRRDHINMVLTFVAYVINEVFHISSKQKRYFIEFFFEIRMYIKYIAKKLSLSLYYGRRNNTNCMR